MIIYNTRKYKSLKDFIQQNNKNSIELEYSIPFEGSCSAVNEDYLIDNQCFYCNFCAFGELKNNYMLKFKNIEKKYNDSLFFAEKPINMPNARYYANNPQNKNLETFTSIEETKRIQLWATCILSECTPYKCISAIEIPAPNENFDRDGRIDIGIKENDYFLFVETKTTLKDAMSDERFVEQHAKYIPTIESSNLADKINYSLLILIGGKETDLYPPNNAFCTGLIGNLSERFYKLLKNNDKRIPFISANAIWLLSLKYLNDDSFSINNFLIELFSDPNCYGLVSAGKIYYDNEAKTFSIIAL